MRLRAEVTKNVSGKSTNYLATIEDEKPIPAKQLPNPSWLEISEEEGAYFLLYIDECGECFADTWHPSIESAQREAMLGFGITTEEWMKVA